MKTFSPKPKNITRNWHLVDAKDQVLGRISTEIAAKLIGKNKPYFAGHLDCGDYVVVINSDQLKVTGNKLNQKTYYIRLIGDRNLSTFNRVQREKKEEINDLLQIIRKFHTRSRCR